MKAPSSIEYAIGEPMPGTKWVVRGKLGQGGMGLVLSVEKAGLIRGAMKVLLPPFAKLPEFAAKFLGEVKVTARLQHASIVQVLDFDQLADGTPFMVMERLRGRTLGGRSGRRFGRRASAGSFGPRRTPTRWRLRPPRASIAPTRLSLRSCTGTSSPRTFFFTAETHPTTRS